MLSGIKQKNFFKISTQGLTVLTERDITCFVNKRKPEKMGPRDGGSGSKDNKMRR